MGVNFNPSKSIETYKHIAETSLKEIEANKLRSRVDDLVIKVLKKELQNLEHEKKRFESAQKVDNLFVFALKYLGWIIATPIRLFVRLFVREKSPEERIQNIGKRILNSLPKEVAAFAALQSYQGKHIQSDEAKKDLREMLVGIGVKTRMKDYPYLDQIKVPEQFLSDITRTPYLTIQNQIIFDGKRNNLQQSKMEQLYKLLTDVVGKDGLNIFLNILQQGYGGGLEIDLATNEAPQLKGIIKENSNLVFVEVSNYAREQRAAQLRKDEPNLGEDAITEMAEDTAYATGFAINVYLDDKNRIHFTFFNAKLLRFESGGPIGLIAYEREMIISQEELANVQKNYQPKIVELEQRVQQGENYDTVKKELIKDDKNLVDPTLTPSLQVTDRVSTAYSLKDGILKARAEAFKELEDKRTSNNLKIKVIE